MKKEDIELIYRPKNPEAKRPVNELEVRIHGKPRKLIKGKLALLIASYLIHGRETTRFDNGLQSIHVAYMKTLGEVKELIGI